MNEDFPISQFGDGGEAGAYLLFTTKGEMVYESFDLPPLMRGLTDDIKIRPRGVSFPLTEMVGRVTISSGEDSRVTIRWAKLNDKTYVLDNRGYILIIDTKNRVEKETNLGDFLKMSENQRLYKSLEILFKGA